MMRQMIAGTRTLAGIVMLLASALHAGHFEHKEHHLGPTGLFGTTSPKDIKVTKVEAGSPGDGKLKAGDVIVAAGNTPFKENARRELADAIDQAETHEGKGVLTLTLKDDRQVDLQLKVLGTYTNTAPYSCPKTDAIITQTADFLVRTKQFGRLKIGLLGLLATGERKYIDVVRQEIHGADWAKPDLTLTLQGTMTTWSWGYLDLLLSEYYLLTGDEYVLPALKAYSVAAARGRDAGGLWGHRMADPLANRGKLHGRLYGYAQMNQPSLSMFISLILADKCGIEDPELQAGIPQTHRFYTSFVGKGALPYGVHGPYVKVYNNNGTSGSAAVAFAVIGDRQGAEFFSRLSLTSYDSLESGHTGHYFNQLWTGLGANVAGPEAAVAFFKRTRWLHTLNRKWDGNFIYDDCEAKGPVFSYRGCSDAGSHLLNYCLGRRKLYITGRDADQSIWLKGKEVGDTIALSTIDYANQSDEQLLTMFGHPMPQVRVAAVWTLRSREHKLLDAIRKMAGDGTLEERSSAIGYFGYGCPPEVALTMTDRLGAILRDPGAESELRATAAYAVCWHGEPAYKYYMDMAKLVLDDEPDDVFGSVDETVGRSMTILCKDPYKAGLVTDKALFYAAVNKLLDHKRHQGRTPGTQLVANIPLEDFHYVADKLVYVIEDKDLTYQSYHNQGPRGGAISVLANLNIKEGIDYAFDTLNSATGKYGFKIRMIGAVLPKYGANAKADLPRLEDLLAKGDKGGILAKAVQTIESATESDAPRMINLEEAKRAGLK